ncbi:hypothetical protein [Sphingobium sp. DC-2]|uniref:hypothetical protein n=1 Tax=Sphingobium sp. DC-2 TaxID=1303256 RepID=UPI0004C43BC7|nr:hypothetical protein [Sphingobium sp. DC-2]|tara:strand:- start:233 stop:529 length:297 start_codon:yes stop_codon:yes gene_type:complete
MHIDQAIAVATADFACLERYVERRERFLDGLDWTAMTSIAVYEAAMLDELLETDMAEAFSYLMHLEGLLAAGITQVTGVLRFDPFPRPWHPEWATLAN